MAHEDQFEITLFTASYDDFEIDIIATDDDRSRTVPAHEFAFRDGAVLQDTGAVARSTRCDIVFLPLTPDDALSVIQRLNVFLAILHERPDEPKPFVHPFTGKYQALPTAITFAGNANDRDFIRMSVTFVEAGLDPAAFELTEPENVTVAAQVADVNSQKIAVDNAVAADTSLATVDDSPTDISADALTAAQRWRDDASLTVREITLELGELSERIDDVVTALALPESVESYPTFIALQRVHGSLSRAADAAIRTAPKLTEIVAEATLPLLTILATFYKDAQKALDKFERTLELNDIRNPAIVARGTQLTVEVL